MIHRDATEPSSLELAMARRMVIAADIPDWTAEHRFHPSRKWRFDFAWPAVKVALEIDGGTWKGGRHNTASGFEKDCEKLNAAAVLGWRVIRVTGGMVRDGRALAALRAILRSCPAEEPGEAAAASQGAD